MHHRNSVHELHAEEPAVIIAEQFIRPNNVRVINQNGLSEVLLESTQISGIHVPKQFQRNETIMVAVK
jgi:hypothetical protein